ncbi:metallophosphoesterase MPPED2-like protein [Lates japonicus]|uniref:Metallophosphoesterase MPPED2-like protein n=1 Tax=Lates japonicus TaxID=270547 RepID=A0AAD3MLB0_LATJO|nr:metallophosphoesterase MPPED2-like protein [Lates japonicus]
MAHGKVTITVDEYSSNPTQAFTHYNINQSRFQPPHVHICEQGCQHSKRWCLESGKGDKFVEEQQSGFCSPENKEPVPFHVLLFLSGLLLLAGRSGGAFVTGEPLIKFPLHP